MPDIFAPFIVEYSVRLPGLGLLVVPASPIPGWLATYGLHTTLTVMLPEFPHAVIGTVEELSQNGHLEQRAILLDFNPSSPLAPGTYLQVNEAFLDLL
jgi:hypothetical protein